MAIGLDSKFNILQQSPHDLNASDIPEAAPVDTSRARWVPSRYNVRAVTEDGRLVLWNSFRGSMSVFGAEQRSTIEVLIGKKGFDARPEGIVKYLYDRGFLLKEGTDEYRRIQHAHGRQQYRTDTLQLILLASEDCNFRCQYCYEEFNRGTMLPWVRTGIKKLVENRAKELKNFSVEWFGGEPLYGFQAVEDLAPFFHEIAEKYSLRYGTGMTTNGYLLTPEVAEKLLAWGINAFQITLDGPAEDHDRSRPARDGSPTFETIFENLRALRQRPDFYKVDLRVNWDRTNLPNLDGFMNLIEKEFGDDRRFSMRFHTVFPTTGSSASKLDLCGTDEALKLQVDIEREARRRGLNIAGDFREVKAMGSSVCYAARPYNYLIGAKGQIMKCTIELDMNDRNIVGQLTEDGELQLDDDKMALWCEPIHEKDTKCQKCVVLPVCMGTSCPLLRFETKKSPCIPLRKNLKKELRAAVDAPGAKARRVPVSSVEASSQMSL